MPRRLCRGAGQQLIPEGAVSLEQRTSSDGRARAESPRAKTRRRVTAVRPFLRCWSRVKTKEAGLHGARFWVQVYAGRAAADSGPRRRHAAADGRAGAATVPARPRPPRITCQSDRGGHLPHLHEQGTIASRAEAADRLTSERGVGAEIPFDPLLADTGCSGQKTGLLDLDLDVLCGSTLLMLIALGRRRARSGTRHGQSLPGAAARRWRAGRDRAAPQHEAGVRPVRGRGRLPVLAGSLSACRTDG